MSIANHLPPRPGRDVAILHLGLHKTGTTYIQSLLKANADLLAALGIVYPSKLKEKGFGHHSLVPAVRGANDISLNYYRRVFARSPAIILSSEEFSQIDEVDLRRLRSLLEPRDVYAVVYFRDPMKWLRSRWTERIKHGYTLGAGAFFSSFEKDARFDQIARRVVSVFGAERSVFVSYDDLLNSEIDICRYLLTEIAGLPIDSRFDWSGAFRNDNPGLNVQEINRAMNAVIYRRGIRPQTWVFQFLIRRPPERLRHIPIDRFYQWVAAPNDLRAMIGMGRKLAREFGPNFMNLGDRNTAFPDVAEHRIQSAVLQRAFSQDAFRQAIDRLVDEALEWCERHGVVLRTVQDTAPTPPSPGPPGQ